MAKVLLCRSAVLLADRQGHLQLPERQPSVQKAGRLQRSQLHFWLSCKSCMNITKEVQKHMGQLAGRWSFTCLYYCIDVGWNTYFSARKKSNFDHFHTEFGPIAFSEVGYQNLSSTNAESKDAREGWAEKSTAMEVPSRHIKGLLCGQVTSLLQLSRVDCAIFFWP